MLSKPWSRVTSLTNVPRFQKCCDVVVRHIAVSPAAIQQTDKFRIHIFEEGCPDVAGKRDVLATLHPGVYCGAQQRHAGNYVTICFNYVTNIYLFTCAGGAWNGCSTHPPVFRARCSNMIKMNIFSVKEWLPKAGCS